MSRLPTLLLIRGLGHSGTTILDLALGAHPQVTGLGEAARILETPKPGEERRGPAVLRGSQRGERRCTCGASAMECPIWGPTLTWLTAHEEQTLQEKMQRLLKLAAVHGTRDLAQPPSVIVDSFQDDLMLPTLMPPEVDVRVIHLVRDVRSWLYSRMTSSRQSHRVLPDLRSLARWWYVNRKFDRVLQRCDRPVLRLGYEELALNPARSLQLVCDWLGVAFSPKMLNPAQSSTSHIVSGNRMRFDQEKTRSFQYDGAWLTSGDAILRLAMLIPPVNRLNQQLVYSNQILVR